VSQRISSPLAVVTLLAEWYFDIETEGTDPQQDRILTIQYQAMTDGERAGSFQMLAEWEWGEKQIVRTIVEKGLLDPTWDFVPVGNHLKFDITFVMEKAERYGIKKFGLEGLRYYWFTKPLIDLGDVLRLMNRSGPQGSSISEFSRKNSSDVPRLYRDGKYEEIIEYVTREKDETFAILREAGSLLQDLTTGRRQTADPQAR